MSEQKARNRDISDGLLRQRRNLLIISLLLPLFILSDASIEKVSLLGTVIAIKNPLVIKCSLVIFFLYFLVRYWQYYLEESYIKEMKRTMKRYWHEYEKKYLEKLVKKKAKGLPDYYNVYLIDPNHSNSFYSEIVPDEKSQAVNLLTKSFKTFIVPFKRTSYVLEDEKCIAVHKLLDSEDYSSWKPKGEEGKSVHGALYENKKLYQHEEDTRYNILWVFCLRVKGLMKYMTRESFFTDYQFPFVFAFLAMIVSAVGLCF